MNFAPTLLLILSVSLCGCAQNNTAGIHIHRLHTAAAHTEETPPPLPHKPQPRHRSHFNVIINETLMNAAGEKHIEINLAAQRGTFFINGQPAMDFPVCTGRKGFDTPTGTFSIKEKRRHHRSNIYHVSMPCFMRLTYDGIGLHVGEIRTVPASHGCIRLPREACLPIFQAVKIGTKVVIF